MIADPGKIAAVVITECAEAHPERDRTGVFGRQFVRSKGVERRKKTLRVRSATRPDLTTGGESADPDGMIF